LALAANLRVLALFNAFDGASGRARDIQCGHQSEAAAAGARWFAFSGHSAQPGQIAGVAALSHNQQRDQLGDGMGAPKSARVGHLWLEQSNHKWLPFR